MMQKLSKRRGAISVFLLIIFMVTYVFMGLLVDAARYRMAQTYVESALDEASDSVLSNYNRLLFDLYGLFAIETGEKEEEEVEKKIQELYNHYLEETLGLADADVEEYRTVLNVMFDSLTDQEEGADISTKQLYDFRIEQLDGGSVISLADPENFENQLIEYMKFRAPVQLVDDVFGSFLEKINGIIALKDQINASMKKLEIMEEYEDLPQEAYELQKNINQYTRKLYWYTVDAQTITDNLEKINLEQIYTNPPYRLKKVLEEFDKDILDKDATYNSNCSGIRETAEKDKEDIRKKYEAMREEYAEMEDPPLSQEEIDKNEEDELKAVDDQKEDDLKEEAEKLMGNYKTVIQKLETKLQNIVSNATALRSEAMGLYDEVDDLIGKYTEYIQKLENEKKTAKDDVKEMYDADIEQIKVSAGSLLRNLDPLFNTRECLGKTELIGLVGWFSKLAETVCNKRHAAVTDPENVLSTDYELIGDKIKGDGGYKGAGESKDLYLGVEYVSIGAASSAKDALKKEQSVLCILYSYATHFQNSNEVNQQQVDDGKETSEKEVASPDLDETEEEEEKPNIPALDNASLLASDKYKEYLTVKMEKTVSDKEGLNTGESVEGKVDAKKVWNILKVAQELVEGLGKLLETGRDNLYINAYITSMLPNYYDYKKYGEYLNEDSYDKSKVSPPFQKEYWDYTASYASVEYIITGAGAKKGEVFASDMKDGVGVGELSMKSMRTRLFGTRLIFNCLSMFIDSAKRMEASTLSAWAGPFAPLVSLVLMVAWAVAESVLDVYVLTGTGGEVLKFLDPDGKGEVPLIKQGDWYFSLSSVLDQVETKLVNDLVDNAVDGLTDKLQDVVEEAGEGLKNQLNSVIYDAYAMANQGLEKCAQGVKDAGGKVVGEWADLIRDRTDAEPLSGNVEQSFQDSVTMLEEGLSGEFGSMVDTGKEKAEQYLGSTKDLMVSEVSRVTDNMVEKVNEKIEEVGDKVGDKAKELISKNLSNVLPKNSKTQLEKKSIKFTLSYKDYMNIYLFIMNGDMKVRRVQSILQANMHAGGQDDFWMEGSPATVWADLECSMKYMFLSDSLVPKDMRRNGRLRLKVISGQSY